MLHHGSVWGVHSKECYFKYSYAFLVFFLCVCSSSKNLCFYHFHLFFWRSIEFPQHILTNQKLQQVIRNWSWNCMMDRVRFTGSAMVLYLGLSGRTTSADKIFEKNSSFRVKQRTAGKVQFLLAKFSLWEGDWALGYTSMKF